MINQNRSIISLQEYFDKGKDFVVPYYQRGYVWGKSRLSKNKEEADSVSYIIESLVEGYNTGRQIFIQGVTVSESDDEIELIDGQQRTTFFYLLMMWLQVKEKIQIKYTIREDSNQFLKELYDAKSCDKVCNLCEEKADEKYQDIYYFKKTIRTIDAKLGSYDQNRRESFANYVLKNVCFLYIDIPQEKATSVFKMMNGNRAEMKYEDVLKAEMLRLVSLDNDENSDAQKREQDLLRSRYAREWDKWTYWWKRDDVRCFYRVEENQHPLNTLLYVCFNKGNAESKPFNFENFKKLFLKDRATTKNTFVSLRHLQKKFEDIFNDIDKETHLHNTVGAILCAIERIDKSNPLSFITDYLNGRIQNIELFCKICMMSAGKGEGWLTYKGIKDLAANENYKDNEIWQSAVDNFENVIKSNDLYHSSTDANGYKEFAFRQLMLMNIIEDNDLNRAFNFDINWERSIEHIHAKSKVYRQLDNGTNVCAENTNKIITQNEIDENPGVYLKEADLHEKGCSQHCIGNFALLYFYDNSQFSDKPFSEKKKILFDCGNEVDVFSSRELLHTIKLFAKNKWGVEEIKRNKEQVINKLRKYYGL